MSRGPLRVVLHHLHRPTGRLEAGAANAQQLQRFTANGEEAVFEPLLPAPRGSPPPALARGGMLVWLAVSAEVGQ
jgi:hypothetical protein